MDKKKLDDELVEQIAGSNSDETAELGRYLCRKFPEFFPDPDNIEDLEVAHCLRVMIPDFQWLSEPGDSRTNTYGFKTDPTVYTHAEFMDYLHKKFD